MAALAVREIVTQIESSFLSIFFDAASKMANLTESKLFLLMESAEGRRRIGGDRRLTRAFRNGRLLPTPADQTISSERIGEVKNDDVDDDDHDDHDPDCSRGELFADADRRRDGDATTTTDARGNLLFPLGATGKRKRDLYGVGGGGGGRDFSAAAEMKKQKLDDDDDDDDDGGGDDENENDVENESEETEEVKAEPIAEEDYDFNGETLTAVATMDQVTRYLETLDEPWNETNLRRNFRSSRFRPPIRFVPFSSGRRWKTYAVLNVY